jgi:hypothetical protein
MHASSSRRTYSWVRMHAASSSRQLSDKFGRWQFCQVLIWQWPSGRVPYRFKTRASFAMHHTAHFFLFSLAIFLGFGCFSRTLSRVFILFCLFLHFFFSIPGILLYLLLSFQFFLTVRFLRYILGCLLLRLGHTFCIVLEY